MSDRPLAGCRILVTRPEQQSAALCAAIEEAGGVAVRFPVIRITPRDPQVIRTEFAKIPRPDIVIFVSSNAVEHGLDVVRDSGALVAAVGPATAAAIEAGGMAVDLVSSEGFDSEHLLALPELESIDGKSVTIVRGDSGRELLRDTLESRGAAVSYLSVYRRELNEIPAEDVENIDRAFSNGEIDCVTIMSVGSLRNLLALLPDSARALLRETPLVAPGKRVIQTACELVPGIPAIMASGPRAADLLNALVSWRNSGQNE